MNVGKPISENILFVDGDCVLCRQVSRFVINADVAGRLRVAPLAGETARRLLSPKARIQGDWVVLFDGTETIRAAEAVVHTLQLLGGRFALLGWVIGGLPRSALSAIYRFVARRRRYWFGHVQSCSLPKNDLRPEAVLD